MIQNSNKRIVVNAAIMYGRLIVMTFCSIFAARFALKALGEDDFGVFSVVGGIISFIAILNTIMIPATTRFITVAIGKGKQEEVNKVFNTCLSIHAIVAVLVLFLSIPIGGWYIYNHLNYEGVIDNVMMVFCVSIIGSVISFIGVPYHALLVAVEKFVVFSVTDIISSLIRLAFCYSLVFYFEDKLFVYVLVLVICSIIPVLVNIIYCIRYYLEYTYLMIVKDIKLYKEIFGFSFWISYGAIVNIGKAQGSALLVNTFFTTALNAALGLANQVNAVLMLFANSLTQSFTPQITKCYASGEMHRCETLVIMASKCSFSLMLLAALPFLLVPDFIYSLWLGNYPSYLAIFSTLLIIDALVGTFNQGISVLVQATGRIRNYQLIINTIMLLSIGVGFLALKRGMSAEYLFIIYIAFSIISVVFRQIVLSKIVKSFNVYRLVKESYIPSIIVAVMSIPCFYIKELFHPIMVIIFSLLYVVILLFFIGLNSDMRKKIIVFLKNKIKL